MKTCQKYTWLTCVSLLPIHCIVPVYTLIRPDLYMCTAWVCGHSMHSNTHFNALQLGSPGSWEGGGRERERERGAGRGNERRVGAGADSALL